MKAGNRQGLTLVEVLVAAALCAVLLVLAGMAVITLFTLTENQSLAVAANQQGMKAVDDIGRILNDAVLPIPVKSVGGTEPGATPPPGPWDNVASSARGFGASGTGSGTAWRQALVNGVDNLAFAQLVNVLGSAYDNRYDKNDPDPARSDPTQVSSHVLLGQVRGGRGFLGAGIQARNNPQGEYRFDFCVAPSEPVNILARVNPAGFNSQAFETIALPTDTDWRNITLDGNWPGRTAFMAIRYIPAINPGTGAPWIVNEAAGFRGNAIDLDGDGDFTGSFHVGRLQLLYSGGTGLFTENAAGTLLAPENLGQMAVDLTRDVVLRRANPAQRVPLFQLANPNPSVTGVGTDDLGAYLRVRLLIADNAGVGADGLRASPYAKTLVPRWYESGVFMQNMSR